MLDWVGLDHGFRQFEAPVVHVVEDVQFGESGCVQDKLLQFVEVWFLFKSHFHGVVHVV